MAWMAWKPWEFRVGNNKRRYFEMFIQYALGIWMLSQHSHPPTSTNIYGNDVVTRKEIIPLPSVGYVTQTIMIKSSSTEPQLKKLCMFLLTHWGRVTHIFVSIWTIIGPDNGLSPGWRQAIIWTKSGIFLIRILGTNSKDTLNEIHTCSFRKICLKMSSVKWRQFWLRLNVFN